LRIVPAGFVVRRPQRMIERHIVAYRRQWLIIVSGFFEPLFYLLSMRAGVGELVGTVSLGGKQIAYDAFVAPALMASSAMNGAIFDSTGNVFHRLKFSRIYDAALATPMSPTDVAVGEIGWALIRGQIYAIGFLGVMTALGLVDTWWALLALPACALIGLTFASIGFLGTTFMRSWADMEVVNTATMPLFLFSTVGHSAVLAVLSITALVIAARRIDSLLRS
jgi:lipooligosaccharide transport system permease protein